MKIQFKKQFIHYAAAVTWLEAHGYDQSVCDIADSGAVTVTLEGEHARRAIEDAAKVRVIAQEPVPA